MKRGQRSPGSKACPKLKTLPLPVNSIEFRLAAPMASAAAASPVRCCAWPGVDSTTANPAASVQYIRIVGSSQQVISDCRRIVRSTVNLLGVRQVKHCPAYRCGKRRAHGAYCTRLGFSSLRVIDDWSGHRLIARKTAADALCGDSTETQFSAALEGRQSRSRLTSRIRAAPAEDSPGKDLTTSDCFARSALGTESRATADEAAASERELRRHLAKIQSSLRGLVRPQNFAM